MNFATWMIPLFFLMFLILFQAGPETYYETIDEVFKGMIEGFEEKYPTEFDSQDATIQTMISLFLKAAVYSMFGIAIMVVWVASIVPLSGETLLWLYIAFFIIGNIPWSLLVGVGLLINDKIKERKKN